jgi:hypothetical protein
MTVPDPKTLVTRIGLLAILGVSIAAAGTVLWQHYSGLVDAKAALTAEAATLKSDLAGEKARSASLTREIDRWDRAAAVQAQALQVLAQVQAQAQAPKKELSDVQSKHDLAALARRKPGLVEGRVNAGTARAFRMLERASGVPATADAPAASPSPAGPDAGKP